MAENYKVSCEINLSKKIRNDTEEKVIVDMKLFTCEICSKSFNHKCSMQLHLKRLKNAIKFHEKIEKMEGRG